MNDPLLKYREQHKKRLSYMPWLYFSLKPRHREWAQVWQQEYQDYLRSVESIQIGKNCFIAPEAQLFAEPNRNIIIGDGSFVAADCVLHGPINLGEKVAVNHHCTLDGGRKGVHVAKNSRLAAYCHLYAFNHGMKLNQTIHEQAVSSQGIYIGEDVWLGANVGVVDGVSIGDFAVVGMDSTVTRNVDSYAIVAGSPARIIGDRRNKK
ncbi:acyltransferase [Alkanindiges sp. WGS2144]|uniref:acyltransferase n=1 Tax=Alkanindiges sp. WGS2144 TaxID=3366808 RepID=UPI0037538E0C